MILLQLLEGSQYTDIRGCLKEAFLLTSDRICEREDASINGTTATVVLQIQTTLYVANVGDSRAVIGEELIPVDFDPDDPKADFSKLEVSLRVVSTDHRLDLPAERDRVIRCGGSVHPKITKRGHMVGQQRMWLKDQNVLGLMISRALGDKLARTIGCIAEPDISVTTLCEEHCFVLVASDGVWDVVPDPLIVKLFHSTKRSGKFCDRLCRMALHQWGLRSQTDNISIAVILLQREENKRRGALFGKKIENDPVQNLVSPEIRLRSDDPKVSTSQAQFIP